MSWDQTKEQTEHNESANSRKSKWKQSDVTESLPSPELNVSELLH